MGNLLVELSEMARQVTAQLDTRTLKLETLLKDADQRIAALKEANRQRFSIGPLEPGFGHTIGNSLRRTLLSSIPGAAITNVRFDDALHEFDTIQGIAEDVTDIVLNIKDVVLTSTSEEEVVLRPDSLSGTLAQPQTVDHHAVTEF